MAATKRRSRRQSTPSLADVAKAAGVAPSTVSRALSVPGRIGEATRLKVEQAAQKLGYEVNQTARNLRMGQTRTIMIVLPDRLYIGAGQTVLEVLRSAADTLTAQGFSLVIANVSREAETDKHILSLAFGGTVAGVLLMGTSVPRVGSRELTDFRLPVVSLHFDLSRQAIHSVVSNDREASAEAVRTLIEMGHTSFLYVRGRKNFYNERERLKGVQIALAASRLKHPPLMLLQGDFNFGGGVDAGRQFLELRPAERPSVVICANDDTAIGFIKTIVDGGLRVPQDISVLGFDGAPVGAYLTPSLSTVEQSTTELGRLGAELIIQKILGDATKLPMLTRVPLQTCHASERPKPRPPATGQARMTSARGNRSLRGKAIVGTFFHAPQPDRLEVLEDALIVVDARGTIESVVRRTDPNRPAAETDHEAELLRVPSGTYVLPGFVDLHIHAPQYPQLGIALDEPLEVWLTKYTFPLEANYADLDLARDRYAVLVDDLLANGTTTAVYFATQDRDATTLLADICLDKGQRALVGKVVMDNPESCPTDYRDADTRSAVADTRAVIDHIRRHPSNGEARVLPVVTPRFIPSCTDETLSSLGALASELGCHIQTHGSESDWAHGYTLSRFGRTDTDVLEGFGLLTRRTVVAHGNFITDDDMGRLAQRGSSVAHCALSNIYFANSVFPLAAALARGVRVGLGTDISGGPSGSMFDACRTTVQSSRMLEDGVDPSLPAAQRGRPNSAVSLVTAFHLATAAGGDALDLPIGRFEVGYKFDAIAVDTTRPEGGIRLFGVTEPHSVLEKIIHTAARPNLSTVWVDGLVVAGSDLEPA